MSTHATGEHRQAGQTIAVLAIAMVALLAMVALIVDGGTAFAQQRLTQNGADASSEAGAVVLMQRLAGVSPAKTGGDVDTAVQTNAAANGLVTPVQACYTDINGIPLNTNGSSNSNCQSAAQVGQGLPIPPCSACPGNFASGVRVHGSRPFGTFFAGILGLNTFTASANATAISGYVTGYSGAVIPVTYPVFATACDGSNNAVGSTTQWPWGDDNVLTIPLCKDSQGNVGWLDWTPPAGGASELANAILGNPPNPTITTPRWYDITATGNVNSGQVQTALEFWIGTTIMLPIFQYTCDGTPANLSNPTGQVTDCAAGGNNLGGHGTNNWYFLVGFAGFHLDEVWVQGSHTAQCNAHPVFVSGGNGGTSCLVGYFVGPEQAVSLGASVGAGGGSVPNTSIVGVQLIR